MHGLFESGKQRDGCVIVICTASYQPYLRAHTVTLRNLMASVHFSFLRLV
jgi:hypothetical protein